MLIFYASIRRYQKKIGTYDKEPWEKTVEQKILDGFSSVTLKTAKLKTELIDVDLVRGTYKFSPISNIFLTFQQAGEFILNLK